MHILSLPTWIIHFGSVAEWGLAMLLFYSVGRKFDNVWLRRFPAFMLPYFVSGICAILFHVTDDTWLFFEVVQKYLTFLGSCCFALWGYMLLRSLTPTPKGRKR